MSSRSWQVWITKRAAELDEIEAAHRSVGGSGRGRRFATEQLNHAYAVLLASQYQGFCRDLHSECIEHLVGTVTHGALQSVLGAEFQFGRALDRGNASPAAIGTDFGRLGIDLWATVYAEDPRNLRRRARLEELNDWRNAIAHQDFTRPQDASRPLHLARVRVWRNVCFRLGLSFDSVLRAYLARLCGVAPW